MQQCESGFEVIDEAESERHYGKVVVELEVSNCFRLAADAERTRQINEVRRFVCCVLSQVFVDCLGKRRHENVVEGHSLATRRQLFRSFFHQVCADVWNKGTGRAPRAGRRR